MKRIVVFIFCLVQLYAVYGQDSLKVSNHAKSAAVVLRLSRELALTEKQEAEVYDIMQKRWPDLDRAKSGKGSMTRTGVDNQTLAELKKILTPGQLSEFIKLRQEKRRQTSEFKAGNPGYRFSEIDADLDF